VPNHSPFLPSNPTLASPDLLYHGRMKLAYAHHQSRKASPRERRQIEIKKIEAEIISNKEPQTESKLE